MKPQRPPSIVPNTYVPSFSIGGSDVGAIMGINKFKTILDVYNRLVNNAPEIEDSDIMERGRYLEPVCAFKYEQATGRTVSVVDTKIFHEDYPFLSVSLDRLIVAGQRVDVDGNGVLEAKAPGDFVFDKYVDDGFDESYYAQLQHGMYVGNYKWGSFAMFAGGKWKLWWKDVERDEPFIERMETKCIDFWNNNVLKKIPPGLPDIIPDFPRAALGGRSAYMPEQEWVDAAISLREAEKEFKVAEAKKKSAQQVLKDMMGDITHVTIPGVGKISWSESDRRNFNKEAFQAAHPEVDLSPFMDIQVVRTFRPTLK